MKRKKKSYLISFNPKRNLFHFFLGLILISFFWLADTLTSTPNHFLQSDQPTELFANQSQDDLRQVLKGSIQQAKQSVLLIIYTLTDNEIIQSLRKKSEEDIDVRVIYDAKASPAYLSKKLGPKVKTLKRYSPGLMHQKILIIDNELAWIGSANMTGESLRLHGNLMMAMRSQELASLLTKKASSVGPKGHGTAFLHEKMTIGEQPAEMWLLPDDQTAIVRLKELIRAAKKTIRIAMFTWTRMDLAQSVIDAMKRGVDTRVVIDQSSGKGASSKIVQMLLNHQVPVRLGPGNALLHHKFLYIDGNILVNGSANWTKAAFTKNDDCFIILHDLTEKQQLYMDKLWDVIAAESTNAEP